MAPKCSKTSTSKPQGKKSEVFGIKTEEYTTVYQITLLSM